jgi:putative NADH-flavin reductase
MSKIVIIGASGFVGAALLQEALSRGHQVKALVRNPEKIKIQHEHLEIIQGDAQDAQKVAEVAQGSDAVISAYNPGWGNKAIYDDTLKGYKAILEGVKKAGVKRLLIVGGAGSLFVKPGLTVIESGAIPDSIMPGVKGLAEVYYNMLLPEKSIDWVFFSPAGNIEPGNRTGKFRLGKDDLIVNEKGESKISVEDYAVAYLDEFETPKHHQTRFTIGY